MGDQIKAIWNKHIEVQEQLLRARAIPIPIDTTSIRIAGEKLLLTIDERNRTDKVLSQIAETFGIGIDELKISEGYFLVDVDKSNNVDADTKRVLSETAEHDHIKFRPNPIVDGIIIQDSVLKHLSDILKKSSCDYSFDKSNNLFISIEDLARVRDQIDVKEIHISDTARIAFNFNPNPLFYLKKLYPDIFWEHRSYYKSIRKNNCLISKKTIGVWNESLPKEILLHLNELFGLTMCGFRIICHINPDALSLMTTQTKSAQLPKIDDDGHSFSFSGNVPQFDNSDEWFVLQKEAFEKKLGKIKKVINDVFGVENATIESYFEYEYDIKKFTNDFFPTQTGLNKECRDFIHKELKKYDILIQDNKIIFYYHWKDLAFNGIKYVLETISSFCPYVILSFFQNHKCSIKINKQNTLFDEIETKMRDSFPSIQFHRNNKKGTLYFFQEYFDRTKRNQIARNLYDELNLLNSSDYSYEVYSIPPDKDKYFLTIDKDSLQESLSDTMKDLRGHDFVVGEVSVGKLIQVNYPQLTFDVSSSDKDMITYYANNNLIGNIAPDLTGDLEKITRLKKSFEAISSGMGLSNPRLSDFIFDASKAKTINEVDCYLDSRGEFYNDINDNLLNRKINESQKKAIIKTLLAEDLTLIQGPPGTGKSTAIAEIIWQHIRKNPKERILLTSETNLAVDNAIARVVNTTHNLIKPIRFGEDERLEMEGKQFNIDTLRAWVENASITYSEEEEDSDEPNKESDIHQKIILENWLSNISRRIDASQMDESICSLWEKMLQNPSKEIRQIAFDKYIHNCNVVGATCSSIGDKNTKGNPTSFFRTYCELFGAVKNITNKDGKSFSLFNGKIKFDTVIQDESSKATPAELSLPLIYGKKNIIIGDHRQLPPLLDKEEFLSSLKFLLNKIDDKKQISEIKKLQKFVQVHFDEMVVSHFQRLFESIDDSLKGVFNQQYRMHPAINEVIKQFYVEDGGLFCGLDETQVEDPDVANPQSRYHGLNIDGIIEPKDHVIWIDTKTPEMLVGTSRVNYGEVEAIRSVLTKMHNSESFKHYQSLWDNDEDKQIGLISFYGKQIKLLKSLRSDFKGIPIRISTVDRFQGMERNIIIVSMVRSNCITADKSQNADYELYPDLGFASQNDLGFAQSPNRLNVALSRAKRLLIIVGNSDLFRRKHIYDNVYQCIQNSPNGKIINAEEL